MFNNNHSGKRDVPDVLVNPILWSLCLHFNDLTKRCELTKKFCKEPYCEYFTDISTFNIPHSFTDSFVVGAKLENRVFGVVATVEKIHDDVVYLIDEKNGEHDKCSIKYLYRLFTQEFFKIKTL